MRGEGRPLDTVADIDTPERMCFSCRLAGPGSRALAYAIDCAVRAAALAAVATAALGGNFAGWDLSGLGTGLALVALFVVEWGYYVACELWLHGQSLGKRALGLRVVSADGLPIGLRESALRNLLRAADFLPSANVLGALVMGLDPRFRRLGDLVAGTIVIVEGKEPMLPPIQLSPAATPEEL
ncbi:MAG TPA: RDD family protein, partial [Polyangiaceae bacterium]|nr:RDD family protein [Polyangiaceae bacterium]